MGNFLSGLTIGVGIMALAFYFDPRPSDSLGLIFGVANIILGILNYLRRAYKMRKV